ncbi:hypothetical protein [Streptomyces sp. NPDC096311]|uniref:hypothetical protein n=1 Tax=Streptomyces sp. NPDC096311 TaxID=3366083 RepID=UPI003801553D
MDEREVGVPWHVLEGVPTGREEIPGLLRGLTIPGRRRGAWRRLEKRLGWSTADPVFAHVAARLFALLPEFDRRLRCEVLELLARRAWTCRRPVGVHFMSHTVFASSGHHVVPFVADRAAAVRTRAAWVLRELPDDDPAALDALRRQAAVESDPTALVSELLAVGRYAGSGTGTWDPAEVAAWLRPWLHHRNAHVRLAAAKAVLTAGVPAAVTGTGRTVARTVSVAGEDPPADAPWKPVRHVSVAQFADLMAPYPQEAAALVHGLARHHSADLRAKALLAAGIQLGHWRSPAPDLWETVAMGLEDETRVASAALEVLARGGRAVAPYADRVFRFVERSGVGAQTQDNDTAVTALIAMEDDRAPFLYRQRLGNYQLNVDRLPGRWATELLPPFRARLARGPEAGGVPEVLHVLAQWGAAAAPAVRELAALLDTPSARPAAEALGQIGPAAAAAAGLLARLATGEARPQRFAFDSDRPPNRWHGEQTAAWAHWRITGDPELALRVSGAAVRAGLGRPVLRYLADLGPLATAYADAVRPLLDGPGEWSRIGAAEAWWRITGDPAPAVAALLPELAPLAAHRAPGPVLRTVRVLGSIGTPAAAALPTLHAVTASPRRYGGSILVDEELCRIVRTALARIG